MSALPDWVKPGAKCVCVDDNWIDIFNIGSEGPFPKAGERYTVAIGINVLGGFLILGDQTVAPDHYTVKAFRPLTPLERDVAMFDQAFKGVAARAAREPEPAL